MKYSSKIIKHFKNPQNMGKMKDPSVKKRVGNPVCGDVMELSLKIEGGKIKDAKFQTFGCAAAIATSSILTQMIKGKKIEKIKNLKPKDIDESLGGLPKIKKHCADLSMKALKGALEKFKEKKEDK